MKNPYLRKSALVSLLALCISVPASAGTKEQLIQLQTQVQALQDQMSRMQQSFDERMGVMRDLVEKSTDGVNRLNASLEQFDKSLQTQKGGAETKVDQVSTQVQALQDSVDELKARLAKVTNQLEQIQTNQQNLQVVPSVSSVPQQPQQQAPPPEVLYNNALRDYNAAKYDLAQQEFAEYIKFYSGTDLAGNAQFYLADIYFRQQNYGQAVREYDRVLEQYPGGNKTAAAQLKKGYALIELGKRDDGITELRSLVARYPRSIEATQAKDRLRRLGAAATAAKPSPAKRSNN